jgi:hypothetical protein
LVSIISFNQIQELRNNELLSSKSSHSSRSSFSDKKLLLNNKNSQELAYIFNYIKTELGQFSTSSSYSSPSSLFIIDSSSQDLLHKLLILEKSVDSILNK